MERLFVAAFLLGEAFWVYLANAARLLEDGRGLWWLAFGFVSLFGAPALCFALLCRRRWAVATHGVLSAIVLALCVLPWHPRKAFLDDLGSLTPGMSLAEARSRMARHVENDEAHAAPALQVPVPSGRPIGLGTETYRWNTADPRYNADLGIVEFRDGKVVRATFAPD